MLFVRSSYIQSRWYELLVATTVNSDTNATIFMYLHPILMEQHVCNVRSTAYYDPDAQWCILLVAIGNIDATLYNAPIVPGCNTVVASRSVLCIILAVNAAGYT